MKDGRHIKHLELYILLPQSIIVGSIKIGYKSRLAPAITDQVKMFKTIELLILAYGPAIIEISPNSNLLLSFNLLEKRLSTTTYDPDPHYPLALNIFFLLYIKPELKSTVISYTRPPGRPLLHLLNLLRYLLGNLLILTTALKIFVYLLLFTFLLEVT